MRGDGSGSCAAPCDCDAGVQRVVHDENELDRVDDDDIEGADQHGDEHAEDVAEVVVIELVEDAEGVEKSQLITCRQAHATRKSASAHCTRAERACSVQRWRVRGLRVAHRHCAFITLDAACRTPARRVSERASQVRVCARALRARRQGAAPREARCAGVRRVIRQRASGSGHKAAGIRQRHRQRGSESTSATMTLVGVADADEGGIANGCSPSAGKGQNLLRDPKILWHSDRVTDPPTQRSRFAHT